VAELAAGRHGVMMGLRGGEIRPAPLEEVVTRKKALDPALIELAAVLAQ
jgi:hypothetical protein